MDIPPPPVRPSARRSFIELFTPKIITVLREGYRLASLRTDLLAGLTVAIVALPLSMAIAIASGATPERGLFERYDHRRYHESLDNLTPADVFFGRGKTILLQRERIKRETIELRRLQHRQAAA